MIVGFGSGDAHAAAVGAAREKLVPLFELVTPMPYVALQQMFNEGAEWGILAYEKAVTVDDLIDEVIDVLMEQEPKKSFPVSFLPIFFMDGRFTEVAEDETAFGGDRRRGYVINISGLAQDAATIEAERAWVRGFWEALRPYARGSGSYVNFQSEPDGDRIRNSYGPDKYARLASLKAKYDPDNTLHLNANIPPA